MQGQTAKELWESLERKYKTEDAGTKKFVVARFLDYKMVDSKNVISQVQDLQGKYGSENVDMIAMVSDVCAMISEVNLVGTNNSGWWIDTGATRHVCADKSMFHSFRAVDNGQKLYMGNSATADIKGEGDVILKMTSEKELKLTLSCMFQRCAESVSVNAMFKLNVMVVKNDINKMNSSAYLIESSNVWHGLLLVYLLKSKDEAIDKFVLYKTEVENQLGKKIKVVRSDRGGEYVAPFAELCAKHGIRHEFTAPYSPQQNGIAERKNRTLKEMVTAMLISSGMSQDMWGEAILTATYLLNKIPRKEKEETPYELWMGRKPSYQYLRVWGCLAKVVVPTPKAQKIGPKSVDCIFIGYAKNSTAYRFIVHESKNPDIQKNTIMESRNASFFENIFPCLSKGTGSSSRLDDKVLRDKRQRDDNDLQDERQDQTDEEEVEPRRSKRARNEKSFGPDFVSFMVENEPTSYREAAINGSRMKKMKADGTVDKYKARVQRLIIRSTKDMLKSKFDMKDMGLADVILGIKIIRTQNGLVLSQAHYVDKILIYIMRGIPAKLELQLTPVPDLLRIMQISRLSRYTSNLSYAHWKAITRISDIKDSRSTSGYVFTLGGAANLGSLQANVIAKSTMESEFIALDKCGEEAEWLRQFVEDIPRWPKPNRLVLRTWTGTTMEIDKVEPVYVQNRVSVNEISSLKEGKLEWRKMVKCQLRARLASMSGPAVQQLWTLYPGKQTANLF
ncbi:retrotransposon protein, putative, ty1-copia subclass [Tanacetum coccineum]|uniref:Retrotransposon protein, putative, ty1-copia subclass n=1 Tax=Tanacetum coccineum TaxID=301880 RepID=A0ABQ5DP87_9ASTR